MQAVILAAGRGTRMGALTESTPKPMLEVLGRPLLEYKFDTLPYDVDEVILIVGYLGSKVQNHFGGSYKGKRVLYVEQEKIDGTAGALWRARSILKDKFLVMNGDNLYDGEDVTKCAAYDWAVLVQEKESVRTGRVMLDEKGFISGIKENSEHASEKGYANTGLYMLDMRVFDYEPIPKAPGSDELGLPQTMMQAVGDIKIKAVPARFWFEIKAPEDLQKAAEILEKRQV